MSQEPFNLGCAHIAWMAFVVKQYEPLDSINLGAFGAFGIMQQPHLPRHLIEQFRRLRWPRIRWRIHSFQLAIGSQAGQNKSHAEDVPPAPRLTRRGMTAFRDV